VSVDRYDLVGEYDVGIEIQSEGDYVWYEDYQLLESRVRELEAERDRLKEENGNMDSMYQDRLLDMEAKVCTAHERIKVLEDALKNIARQNLESEMHEYDREDADYRGAYDCIIRVARAALEVK